MENIVRKGEIACNKQSLLFSLFSTILFSTLYGTYFPFQIHFEMSSAICFNLDQSKILLSGNGLNTCTSYWQFSLFPSFFQTPSCQGSFTLSKTTNYRLFQTERVIADDNFRFEKKWQKVL